MRRGRKKKIRSNIYHLDDRKKAEKESPRGEKIWPKKGARMKYLHNLEKTKDDKKERLLTPVGSRGPEREGASSQL